MTKEITSADRARMSALLQDLSAISRVNRLHSDSNVAGVLNAIHGELKREHEGYVTRAREAAQERMAKAHAAKGICKEPGCGMPRFEDRPYCEAHHRMMVGDPSAYRAPND